MGPGGLHGSRSAKGGVQISTSSWWDVKCLLGVSPLQMRLDITKGGALRSCEVVTRWGRKPASTISRLMANTCTGICTTSFIILVSTSTTTTTTATTTTTTTTTTAPPAAAAPPPLTRTHSAITPPVAIDTSGY